MKGLPLLVPLVLLAACGPDGPVAVERPPAPGELPPEAQILAEIDRTRGTRDCFDVIRDPRLVPAGGRHGLEDDEMVLGVDVGDAQVAYPIRLLNFHEIVEHRVAGIDLLACW